VGGARHLRLHHQAPHRGGHHRADARTGEPIKGDYKFTDEFPMADGFEENAEFFTLTYENPVAVGHNRAFERIAPLLWLRAGSEGRRIDTIPPMAGTWPTPTASVGPRPGRPFAHAVEKGEGFAIAYIVTDDDRRFQSVARQLPDGVEPVRLYESYLSNFRFTMGRAVKFTLKDYQDEAVLDVLTNLRKAARAGARTATCTPSR
jgi:hypothetical protein